MKSKKKSYPYQRRGIWKLHRFQGRALLSDEMGLGKTRQALMYAKVFLDEGPVVVMCPKSIKWNWQREARDVGMYSIVLEKMRPPDNTSNLVRYPEKTVYIANYDILGSSMALTPSWNKFLKRLKPKLIILDEVHYIKSRNIKRTRNVRELCHGVKKVIGISGTPLTNRPAELWPALNIIRPELFPNFLRFANRYCRPEWTPWGVKYTGAARLDELHYILKRECMIRRRKKDVLKDLPSKTREVVLVELSNYAEYQEAERDIIAWLRKTHPQKANRARNAERMVRMGYLMRLIGELKMNSVKEWISNFLEESSGKLITFAIHKKIVRPLHELYQNTSVRVDGSITGLARQEAVDKFTRSKACRLFFGNIQAAGVGWNGQIANSVMFAELGWTPGEHVQAEDRAHRIGQKKPVTVYYLIAKNTIEEAKAKAIEEKQKILDEVLDGELTKEGFNVYEVLENILLEKK